MNAGYYKLAKHVGQRCHSDLANYFAGRSDRHMFAASKAVADLYTRREEGFYLCFDRDMMRVVGNNTRLRRQFLIGDILDNLTGYIDQTLELDGRRYILDFKFVRRPIDNEMLDDVRRQVGYYCWLADDPSVVGGMYIIANIDTNEVLTVGRFEYEKGEPERAALRLIRDNPGYEGIEWRDVRRVG